MKSLNLEDAYDTLLGSNEVNTETTHVAFSEDFLNTCRLSFLPCDITLGGIPSYIKDFFLLYYKTIKQEHPFVFTQEDIAESEYSRVFKFYLRLIEKYLFDYCLFKGLKFSDYRLEQDIYFTPDFSSFKYNYNESMYHMYIYFFLDESSDSHEFKFKYFQPLTVSLSNALPVILSHTPETYLESTTPIPAMMLKVKGV